MLRTFRNLATLITATPRGDIHVFDIAMHAGESFYTFREDMAEELLN